MAQVAVPRIFRRLLADHTIPFEPALLSKGTLTELSHILENAVIEHDLPGAVFTGFQDSGNWLRALDLYERLVAPKARSVAVFARGNVDSLEPDGIVRVRLEDDSPLVEEWFLIVLTPRFSAALLGEDTGTSAGGEADRLFESVWTFDPSLITAIVARIGDEVERVDPTTAAAMRAAMASYPPVEGSGPIQDEVMTRIVTALERSRDRLRQAAQLEQLVAEELRHLDRTKNVFLSAVSHELRTPLTVVKGLAETLQRLGHDVQDQDRGRIVDAISDNATRLARLLDDLLDVDRLVRGTLVAQRVHFDASELVRD
jgi:signal transduction histidine kinase